jgi:hypothetical protein
MSRKIVKYNKPLKGVYRYSARQFNRYGNPEIRFFDTIVEVIGETQKSYLVRLHDPILDHCRGDEIFVKRSNVKLKYDERDDSQFWWNKN